MRLARKQHAGVATGISRASSAWHVLGTIEAWIRHSDAKAGATLAFNGALGAILFTLVEAFDSSLPITICAALCLGLLMCSTTFAGLTLAPRIKPTQPSTVSHIFFGSIWGEFKHDRSRFGREFSQIIDDQDLLLDELTDQIYENSRIATLKARCASWAIRSTLAATLFIGTVALLAQASP